MKRYIILALAAIALALIASACGNKKKAAAEDDSTVTQSDPTVSPSDPQDSIKMAKKLSDLAEEPIFDIVTNYGTIKIKLYKGTPLHKANFAKLALCRGVPL